MGRDPDAPRAPHARGKRWEPTVDLHRCLAPGCGVKVLGRDRDGHARRCHGGRAEYEALPPPPKPTKKPSAVRLGKSRPRPAQEDPPDLDAVDGMVDDDE